MHTDNHRLETLEVALEAAGVAWWWMDLPSGTIFYSPFKAKSLGRSNEDFFHYNDFVKLVHPDDQPRIMQDMTNHLEGKAARYETSYRILAKDGTYHTFYDRGKIVAKHKDGSLSVAGIVFDADVASLESIETAVETSKAQKKQEKKRK